MKVVEVGIGRLHGTKPANEPRAPLGHVKPKLQDRWSMDEQDVQDKSVKRPGDCWGES